jgi:hypothetical protein
VFNFQGRLASLGTGLRCSCLLFCEVIERW